MDARARQDALLGWLRGRGPTTLDEAAARFEVSRRTIERDVERLRERDVPVQAERGRGGGIFLDPGRALAPVRLELDEVVGLVLLLALFREEAHLPFGRGARSALAKLLATLPLARGRAIRRLLERVIVAAPASAAVVASAAKPDSAALEAFERAFTTSVGLAFRYTDRVGNVTRRRVEPHGLLVQTPVWYLLAYDLEKLAPRMFRLDRVTRPTLLQQGFTPKPLAHFGELLREVDQAESLSARL